VYGDQVTPFLEDIATLTGGKMIPSSLPPDQVDKDYLGFANKIIVTSDSTTIIGGSGSTEDVDSRIATLKDQLASDKFTAFQKERMEMRLAKLQGKIGIIRVGGATESEVKEVKFRVEDAINATRSAREAGIVAGGATTLALLSTLKGKTEGEQLVYDALAEPFKQLMENAGDDGGYRYRQLLVSGYGTGFDVTNMTDEPIDLFKRGIIDPVSVLNSVVENSCSAAGLAITSKVAITFDRDEQRKNQAMRS